ncbi:hypothetical protein RRG08_032179 [Elysia crispata]|uniref:Uncharacterized protein n=1 Tax=Elysia crispata TaxID=231223 RepID=A0AAE1DVM6_9GAST|nr:hypothetical protein RRG08_032179 [Elysia crispata]
MIERDEESLWRSATGGLSGCRTPPSFGWRQAVYRTLSFHIHQADLPTGVKKLKTRGSSCPGSLECCVGPQLVVSACGEICLFTCTPLFDHVGQAVTAPESNCYSTWSQTVAARGVKLLQHLKSNCYSTWSQTVTALGVKLLQHLESNGSALEVKLLQHLESNCYST